MIPAREMDKLTERLRLSAPSERDLWEETRPCLDCNPLGLPPRNVRPMPECACGGSGWNQWAAFASEPYSEIIPGLFVGGHDYVPLGEDVRFVSHFFPRSMFDVVVSAYHRDGFEPDEHVEHRQVLFEDAALTPKSLRLAKGAAQVVRDRILTERTVLVRCQAGLNRSSLIAGIAMVDLGFAGPDVVQLIRSRRSPWALCNEEYADFIMGLSAGARSLPPTVEGTGTAG